MTLKFKLTTENVVNGEPLDINITNLNQQLTGVPAVNYLLGAKAVFVARLTQGATAAPNVQIIVNTGGWTVGAVRATPGVYAIALVGSTIGPNTYVSIGGGKATSLGDTVVVDKALLGSQLNIFTGSDPSTPADSILNEHILMVLEF